MTLMPRWCGGGGITYQKKYLNDTRKVESYLIDIYQDEAEDSWQNRILILMAGDNTNCHHIYLLDPPSWPITILENSWYLTLT